MTARSVYLYPMLAPSLVKGTSACAEPRLGAHALALRAAPTGQDADTLEGTQIATKPPPQPPKKFDEIFHQNENDEILFFECLEFWVKISSNL